ncbi:ABC-2 type transporter family protein [Striga asiatica]|uniref:ABC-2 type transporter family protein n=1 Tax=Striga asiatica TaxID=4170 RepID=A0A5A7QCU7_STRAF|nr:ABC-2 type transporter family protein [Striga asiatica]
MAAVGTDVEVAAAATGGGEAHEIFRNVNRPVVLKFNDVVYRAKTKNHGHPSNTDDGEKLILKGITGIVRPGEMLAMLGPSGSGKTTLLTALGGRLPAGGSITYNGRLFSNSVRRSTGFVTQDDNLYPHLTVKETLVYTALLRLPRALGTTSKVQHAEAVMGRLGLHGCRDSLIGGAHKRGVSGGERKRVSIGQELLVDPSLLLLDEPTSGLDSTTAQTIVSTLLDLAEGGGRTVLMTIHQPSSKLFYMFHKVLLLSEGSTLYFGDGGAALDYFSGVGFAPSVAMNPADFLLDLANGVTANDFQEDQAAVKQTLVSAYKAKLSESVSAELEAYSSYDNHDSTTDDEESSKWANSWWSQFTVLFRRGLKEKKHETFKAIKVLQVMVVAIISGLLWWQSDISNLQDQVGLLYFLSCFWGFYPVFEAIFTFPQERMMLEKERSSGTYRLSSFFMALTLGDLPTVLVLPTAFYTAVYWMAGLKPGPGPFLSGLAVTLYGVLCAQGLGLAIGALVMDAKSANALASVVVLVFQLASGFYVQRMPGFIGWIRYGSIMQYTYKLYLGTQYGPGQTYPCGPGRVCQVADFPAVRAVGLGGKWVCVAALGLMLVVYRVVAYVALMRIGVTGK